MAAAIFAMAVVAAACNRTETRTLNVTTSSPAGSSTVPSSASAEQRNDALVRVLQVVPSGTTLDLFAGDLLLFDGLGFKTVTPYRAVDGKRYAFALRPAGMTQAKALSSNTEDLKDGDFYTAIAMPGDGHGPLLRVVNDHLDSPSADKARLRIVHAGTDAGQIDVRAAGSSSTLFDHVDYQTVSDYKDVTPMNGQLEVLSAGPSAPVHAGTVAHLEAGRFYTLVIIANASSPAKVEVFLIEDALSR
jgi:Domain of unknown function (DUF4397)